LPLFFLKHGDVHRPVDLKPQLGLHLIGSERLDGLVQHQLLLGDVDAELLPKPVGDLLGGDGAEQPPAVAGLGGELHHALLQLLGGGLRLRLLPGLL
ncbi:PQ loop repeat, partial [Dysosmobacter welbionis]